MVSDDSVQNRLRMGENEAYRKIADNELYRPDFKPDRNYPPIFLDDETGAELPRHSEEGAAEVDEGRGVRDYPAHE